MGCGKTTVGSLLAKKLNYVFIDTDQLIEKRCGISIREIFAAKGEKAFREMESDIANELGTRDSLVVSTGGGLMLNPNNVTALTASGRVFCLIATPEEILARIAPDNESCRPLLKGSDPLKRIEEMITERDRSYKQFSQIDTSGRTPEEVADYLVSIFQSQQDG